MSRYTIRTDDDDLEVFVGFDDGMENFFLTVAKNPLGGDGETYLFHNIDDHPGVGMTLDEVANTLRRFGVALPADLAQKLASDAWQAGMTASACQLDRVAQPFARRAMQILGWQKAS